MTESRPAITEGAMKRFAGAGVRDAVAGLASLTSPRAWSDDRVVRVLESSLTFGVVARVMDTFARSARHSRVLAAVQMHRAAWLGQPAGARAKDVGTLLISAASVHVLLGLARRPVAGWLWLVPPALAAAIGALMIVRAGQTSTTEGGK